MSDWNESFRNCKIQKICTFEKHSLWNDLNDLLNKLDPPEELIPHMMSKWRSHWLAITSLTVSYIAIWNFSKHMDGSILFPDNPHFHTVSLACQKFLNLGWEVLLLAPYSPDLVQSDNFAALCRHVTGKQNEEDMGDDVSNFSRSDVWRASKRASTVCGYTRRNHNKSSLILLWLGETFNLRKTEI